MILTRRRTGFIRRAGYQYSTGERGNYASCQRAANAKAEIVVYPDAGHAFNADYQIRATTKPRRKTAGKAMLEWFAQYEGEKALTTAHYDVCWAYEFEPV